jgi:hypothetical protein
LKKQKFCSLQRLQPRFDLRAARFQERREREFFAERFHRLVGVETGYARA